MENYETQKFQFGASREDYIKSIITSVYAALQEKGYNPVSQMVGYIMSGDPTYITSHNNARSLIRKVERDELLEVLVKHYIEE
ncbi:MAG: IreB family regulatory phosphoprotein [Clostridia bacterium]|nr:IreB family regulatory phosphoprotein [Clostridia bacterium]